MSDQDGQKPHAPNGAESDEDFTRSKQQGGPLFSISHFDVLEKIGAGGMGEVYLAEDLHLRRKVALKLLPKELTQDASRRERFMREARAAAAIEHPNIAVVHDVDEADGRTFIAMEFVRGKSLREMIRAEELTLTRCVDIARQIGKALALVHEHGIVHRDLKPENVLISDTGYVKLIDFGLAKLLEPDPPDTGEKQNEDSEEVTAFQTRVGQVMGTASYMSPEQARGDPVDARSDIFSFGVVLYELLTGEAPFRRKSLVETLSAVLSDAPPPVAATRGKPPVALEKILKRCLAKDPAERYPSFGEVARDLDLLHDHIAGPRPKISWKTLVAGAALVVLLVTGTYWAMRQVEGPPAVAEPVSVLIADFDNATGDPVFDGALEQALSIGLEGASFITSYDRPRARRQAEELEPSASGRLDATLARLVCRSQGIKTAITGAIESRGNGYAIRAVAIDPVTGDTVSEADVRVDSKASVLRAADELSARLRRELGDTAATAASSPALDAETFTTASIEAMNLYAHAQELVSRGEYDAAKAEFEKAIEADPGFGRAYSGLAVLYFNRGERESSQQSFDEAMARMDRMSERERLRTRGTYFVQRGSFQMAVDELSRLVEQYPADIAGHNNLALAHFYLNDMEKAAEHARRGLDIYPTNVVMRNNLALFAMYAGDFERAIEEARLVREANPAFFKAYVAMALSQLALGAPDEAVSTYEELRRIGEQESSVAVEGLADIALYQGRARAAAELLEPELSQDVASGRDTAAARKLVLLAEARRAMGDAGSAAAAAEQALEASSSANILVSAALVFLDSGREPQALALARELGARVQPARQAAGKLIEGLAALHRGAASDAVSALRDARDLADSWLVRYALGRAYLSAEAFPEAHAELEFVWNRRGEATAVFLDDNPTYRYLADVHYYLGVAQQGLGIAAAEDSFRTYLAIQDPGDGSARVEDAKRRLGL